MSTLAAVETTGSGQIVRLTGRPSRIRDDALRQRVVDGVLAGLRPEEAATMAGIPRSTFYTWTQRGRKAAESRDAGLPIPATEEPFLDFLDALHEADARLEAALVAQIIHAGQRGSWRAAAWLLQRRFPGRWGHRPSGEPRATAITASTLTPSAVDLESRVQQVLASRVHTTAGRP